jgi:hypothetical protein
MSNSSVHFSQITEPELLDIVDDAWLKDKLPDDSECSGHALLPSWMRLCLRAFILTSLLHALLDMLMLQVYRYPKACMAS